MSAYRQFRVLSTLNREQLKGKPMAFEIVKKTALPEVPAFGRGRVADPNPSVTIGPSGQLQMNSVANAKLPEGSIGLILFDAAARKVGLMVVADEKGLPKGITLADTFELVIRKDKDGNPMKEPRYANISRWLRTSGYDFAASGRQKFAAEFVEQKNKTNLLTWTLPEGKLTPPPVVTRKKRTSAIAPTPTANGVNGAIVAPQVNTAPSLDDLLG